MRTDVGHPDVAILIDAQAVTAREQTFAERSDELSVLIEFGDWIRAPGSVQKDGPWSRTPRSTTLPIMTLAGTGIGSATAT